MDYEQFKVYSPYESPTKIVISEQEYRDFLNQHPGILNIVVTPTNRASLKFSYPFGVRIIHNDKIIAGRDVLSPNEHDTTHWMEPPPID